MLRDLDVPANLIYSIVAVNCYGIVFAITTFFCFSVVRIFEVTVRLTSEVKQAEQQKETITRFFRACVTPLSELMECFASSRLPKL